MSRSGYCEDGDYLELYRANVERSLASKRGQKFLIELIQILDSMPEKKLIAGELIDEQGQCCTIGAVCKAKGIDVKNIDYYDGEQVGNAVGISEIMAREIEFENDERPNVGHGTNPESPEQRWTRMREWVGEQLK